MAIESTEYASEARKYIEILNNLRRLGAQVAVDLPTVVFCGNQSAGKSSLLEAISGIQLPRSDGTCTRCVMEIRLTREDRDWECQISLRKEYSDEDDSLLPRPFEYKFGPPIKSKDKVELMARRAQKALLNPKRNFEEYINWEFTEDSLTEANENEIMFTKNVVCLEIKGSEVPNLSLIDLPGIIRTTERSDDERFIKLIQDLVHQYVEKEKSIIIATISCRDEVENQEIVQIAKKVDKDGIRTLGVLTKPDTIEDGCHDPWLRIIRGESHNLHLGYYVVKNPNKSTLARGITFDEARKQEDDFFQKDPWKGCIYQKERIGITNLRNKLSKLLISAIKQNLPSIKKELEKKLAEVREELKNIPEPLSDDPRIELLKMSKKCATVIQEQSNSINDEIELFQKINKELARFKKEICGTRPIFVFGTEKCGSLKKFDILEEFVASPENVKVASIFSPGGFEGEEILSEVTEEKVRDYIEQGRGRFLRGFVPYSAVTRLIREFQEKWVLPSKTCLDNVYEIMERLVTSAVQDTFSWFPLLFARMNESARDWLDECKSATLERIDFINSMENTFPFTLDESAMLERKIEYLSRITEAIEREPRSCDDTHELIAMVMAYFRLSFKRYVDVIAMTIIRAFVDRYSEFFEEKLIAPFIGTNDGKNDLENLVKEDERITRHRADLLEREKYLHESLKSLLRVRF